MQQRDSGVAGRIETGQVVAFLGDAGRDGRALYLPQEWGPVSFTDIPPLAGVADIPPGDAGSPSAMASAGSG